MAVLSENSESSLNNVLSRAGIGARKFIPTQDGVVASVYFCVPEDSSSPKEVLKIFEEPAATAREKGLEEAAKLSEEILAKLTDSAPFTIQHMHKGEGGGYLIDVDNGEKVALVSDFIPGERPIIKNLEHARLMGKAMSAFHETLPSQASSESGTILNVAHEYIENIKKTYSERLTDKMRATEDSVFVERADFFDKAHRYVEQSGDAIKRQVMELPSLRGLTHGGLHQENMIMTPEKKIALIDIDTLKENNDQWRDVIYASTRLSLSKNEDPFRVFIENYMDGRSLPDSLKEQSTKSVGALKTLIGLNSLYASLYHHKSVFVDNVIDLATFKLRRSEVARDFDDNATFIHPVPGYFRSAESESAKENTGGYRAKMFEGKAQAGTSRHRTSR